MQPPREQIHDSARLLNNVVGLTFQYSTSRFSPRAGALKLEHQDIRPEDTPKALS